MFEQVLVATDGSECGTRAVRAGIDLADTFDASVTALTAADGSVAVADAESVVGDAREIGASSDVRVTTRVVEGDPRRAIVDVASDVDADVVAMGRHGHTGVLDRLVGSVTAQVLRSSERPVLAVPAEDADVGGYENVLVPSDGSESARAAIRPGATLATAYDARVHALRVVNVVREAGPFSAGGVDDEYVEGLVADAGAELDVFVAGLEEADRDGSLDVEQTVRTGTPASEIATYVADAGVDLVVISSEGGGTYAGQLLGSTTDRVLRTVDVPVLVVHADR